MSSAAWGVSSIPVGTTYITRRSHGYFTGVFYDLNQIYFILANLGSKVSIGSFVYVFVLIYSFSGGSISPLGGYGGPEKDQVLRFLDETIF